MTNVNLVIKPENPNYLWIGVDLNQEHGKSSTGKTIRIASTHGGKEIPGHAEKTISLNIYKK